MRRFTKYPSDYVNANSRVLGSRGKKRKWAALEAEGIAEAEQKGREGSELLATDGDWELWTPKTFDGAMWLTNIRGKYSTGDKAVWDIGYQGNGDRYFEYCSARGPIYIFINKSTGEKYISHPGTKAWFYDANDRPLGEQALIDFLDEHPAFAEIIDTPDGDIEACTDITASYSIPAPNECVPCWQFDSHTVTSFRELANMIRSKLSALSFVTGVGTSGFETVNPDTFALDVDVQMDRDVDMLTDAEIDAIAECGYSFGAKDFEI